MNLFLILIFIFLALFGLGVLFFFWFLLDVIIRRHDLPSDKKARQALAQIISQRHPQAKNFYDLGSGRGTVILAIKKHLPHLQVIGVDLSHFRCALAKIKANFLGRKIQIKRGDLFKQDLSDADVVYAFIWYDLLPPLEQKLQQELKPGAIAITNTVHFFDWPLSEKIVFDPKLPGNFGTLFVYVKGSDPV
ncbi:MAG: class I SAM-dependent methyltransferase [Patescibacteria group bacterium]